MKYRRNADKDIQSLRREYLSSQDMHIGSELFGSLIRRDNLLEFLNNRALEITSSLVFGEAPKSDVFYIGWDTENHTLTTVILVLYSYSELDVYPPKPQMAEFMTHYEKSEYRRRWEEYLNQDRGKLVIVTCRSQYLWDEDTWENNCSIVTQIASSSDSMRYVRGILYDNPHNPYVSPRNVPLLDLLDLNLDFEGWHEELEEEPTVISRPCEDYPCCGHDICPPRWSTGEQAAMVCTCGALLPPYSRYSICSSCLSYDDDFGYRESMYDESIYDEDDEPIYDEDDEPIYDEDEDED